MRKTMIRTCLLALLVPALGGCALLGLGRHDPQIQAMSTLPQDDQAFVEFEIGKQALDQGHYSGAIVAFSAARMEPSLLAPSLNAMGVAYARLGRPDLAERYFREAANAAPDDERFAANLLRVQARAALQQAQAAERQLAQAAMAEPDAVVTSTGQMQLRTHGTAPRLAAVQPTHTPVRIEASRVQLWSVVTEPAQNGAEARVRFARTDAPRSEASPDYPVRISLADVRSRRAPTGSARSAWGAFPVRVHSSP